MLYLKNLQKLNGEMTEILKNISEGIECSFSIEGKTTEPYLDRAIFDFGRTGGGGQKSISPDWLNFFSWKLAQKYLVIRRTIFKKNFSKNCIVTWWRHFQFPNMGKNLRKRVKWGLSWNCHKFVVGNLFSVLFFDSISKKVIKTNSIVKNSKF